MAWVGARVSRMPGYHYSPGGAILIPGYDIRVLNLGIEAIHEASAV
eukprot:CAMPEP_0197860912 /NCGR_PEP_ID=MMETSP1438-20131217/36614_1 /TAXON_ID=1461541 /ORGANISM="Pterosperma sp., Strain CCMP1384" /LENGTH=45 /DNA_ID= /DNA_START= /DNA_END= /DNA_ORIENTATION=